MKFECDYNTADRICCFNRHYAEHSGYAFSPKLTWVNEASSHYKQHGTPMTYFDSVSGKSLFKAPNGRTF